MFVSNFTVFLPCDLNSFDVFSLLNFMHFVLSPKKKLLQNKAREVFTKPRPDEATAQNEQVDANILVENEVEKPKKTASGK